MPTLAVIDTGASGPALDLALACDLRIAASSAVFGFPEIRFGRIPAAGGTQRLPRAVGPTAALRMLLTGERLTAEEAHDLGLIHQAAPTGELDALADALVEEICKAAPIAMTYTKEATRASMDVSLVSGLRIEADLSALLQTTTDRAEGLDAFIHRRRPDFKGR